MLTSTTMEHRPFFIRVAQAYEGLVLGTDKKIYIRALGNIWPMNLVCKDRKSRVTQGENRSTYQAA